MPYGMYENTAISSNGGPRPGATVTVYNSGTSNLSTIYEFATGTTRVNPFSTGDQGYFYFFAEDGLYDVKVTMTGYDDSWDRGVTITYTGNINTDYISQYTSIEDAITTIGSTTKTLIIDASTTVSTPQTIPSTLSIEFKYPGKITKSGTGTLTINGPFEAGLYQVFSGFSAGDITGLRNVLPEWFGAVGDGVSDDTAEVELALNVNGNEKTEIILTRGKKYAVSNVTLNTKYKTLTGGGTLYNGSLTIGLPTGGRLDYDFDINGIDIDYDSVTSGKHGIILQHTGVGQIHNINFRKFDKAIYVASYDEEQHVRRVMIHDNIFMTGNYCLYMDHPAVPVSSIYGTGDLHFNDNQAHAGTYQQTGDGINYTHVWGRGVDGLVMSGNTLFFPSVGEQPAGGAGLATKENNVYLEISGFANITGNNLFESGYEGIYLKKALGPIVANNNIVWSGVRDVTRGYGIRFSDGNNSGGEFVLGSITGNNMMFPTRTGISIENNCGHIIVASNHVRSAGWPTYYYGHLIGNPVIDFYPHYGILTAATTNGVLVGPNYALGNVNSINGAGSIYLQNLTSRSMVSNLTSTAAEIDVAGVSYMAFNHATPATINSISGGEVNQTLVLAALTDNTTLQLAGLRDGYDLPYNMKTGDTVTLKMTGAAWKEISRSAEDSFVGLTGTETTVNASNISEINLNQSAPTTLTSITGARGRQVLTLTGFAANTTLQNNSTIVLRDAVDVAIPVGGTITMRYISAAWREIGRNFEARKLLSISGAETTVAVAGVDTIVFSQGTAKTITNFTGGAGRQVIYALFTNSNTTIQNNANVSLRGAINVTPANTNTITLKLISNVWQEIARNF